MNNNFKSNPNMFKNNFNNPANTANPGINKTLSSNQPTNLNLGSNNLNSGKQNFGTVMPKKDNPFKKIPKQTGEGKQVMNSQGQNIIHNNERGIKPF